jgi:cytochrome P450
MAAAVALLAVHQDEQEIVHKEVMQVIEEDGTLDFPQYSKLTRTLAVFLETSRLYPAGHLGIRECVQDTTLKLQLSEDGPLSDVVMPKGSEVIIDFIGMRKSRAYPCILILTIVPSLEYNPKVFPDPTAFNPSRWRGLNEDSVYSFSVGPRTCIGKKFAMTEAVCFISHLLRDFRVEPLLEVGESVDEWKAKVLGRTTINLTLSIVDVPLRLIRR